MKYERISGAVSIKTGAVSYSLFLLLLVLPGMNCRKTERISNETISLLQQKWSFISENIIYPANPSSNITYQGTSQDYFIFNSDGMAHLHKNVPPFINLHDTIPYSLVNNHTIKLQFRQTPPTQLPPVELTMVKLTDNLLILTNPAMATITNGTSTQIYYGLMTDSLSR